MLGDAPAAYWIGFHAIVVTLLVCDLALFHRKSAARRSGARLLFVFVILALAAAFGAWLGHAWGSEAGLEFASGYLIELSLSVDNLFVFFFMFAAFGLNETEQRKALLYGVAGAMVMRGLFIFAGVALFERFRWIQYVFGLALLIAAIRAAREKMPGPGERPLRPPDRMTGWITRWMPGQWTPGFSWFRAGSRERLLLSAVLAIEMADLLFAFDSIPAVLAVTHRPFVVYTSNVLAILGLRSIYFLLMPLLRGLRFLHFGLAAILGFTAVKMLLANWLTISATWSLAVILVLMAITTAASLLTRSHEKLEQEKPR